MCIIWARPRRKTEETYAKGITELASDAEVGTDPLAYLGLDDTVYELDIHKHRNNDCFTTLVLPILLHQF